MREIAIKAYRYDELIGKAKEKAKQWYINTYDYDISSVDISHELLREKGFMQSRLSYSISQSQGDGACFDAKIDLGHYLVGEFESLIDVDFSILIEPTACAGHYCHANTRTVNVYSCTATPEQEELLIKLEKHIERIREELCEQIFDMLVEQYDYDTSDKCIEEMMQENEYEFDERGNIL